MYYRLNDNYEVCNFKGLPCTIRNRQNKDYHYYTMEIPEILFKCNGKSDVKYDSLKDIQKEFLDEAIKSGMIIESQDPNPMDEPIPVKYYANKHRKTIHWSITGRCNYRCKHCFQSANEGILGEPTLDQCLYMIRQFEECGIYDVAITGGEPLIRSDFWEIIDALAEANIKVSTIYSNGKLINQELIKGLKKRGMNPSFQISFDGKGFHDWFRGIPGAEDAAISAMKLLRENGMRFSCAMCICKENMYCISETAKLLASIGCLALKVCRTSLEGQWQKHKELQINDDDLMQLYMDFISEYYENDISIPIQLEGIAMLNPVSLATDEIKPVGQLINHKCPKEKACNKLICGVLGSAFHVGANGAVVPCMSMCGAAIEPQFPNIFEVPLKEILTDSSFITLSEAKVEDVLNANEKCIDCEYRYDCLGGKCRQMAIGEDGTDYMAACEYTCYIFKSGWRDRIIKAVDEQNEKLKVDNK